MNKTTSRLPFILAVSVIAFILQVVLAPAIAVCGIVPNIMLIAAIMLALNVNKTSAVVAAFVLGILYDLSSQGPLGLMALVFTVLVYCIASFNTDAFGDSPAITVVLLIISVVAGELFHAIAIALLGANASFLTSLLYKALPNMLYDFIIGIIVLIIPMLFRGRSGKKSKGNNMFASGSGMDISMAATGSRRPRQKNSRKSGMGGGGKSGRGRARAGKRRR
ncbi:MAG: rod shape-determining protein MreD [Coriobacteriales bacterium]|jgi:rod shape-determining protein MreD|nr:rod shape-determining protein MreD [Coriobacteriales bacterium]